MLSGAAVGLAVTFVALYVYTAALRVTYPFDLEWEEGAFMDHVLRVVHGQPIYVRPSLDFTPFIYTPGYYYVGVAAVKVLGTSIVTLRAVSILCSLSVFCILGMFAWREGNSRISGVILAGLYAATYEIGGTWFDIARVDSLFLLLLLGAVFLLRFGNTTATMVWAGLLLAAALLTKQLALAIAPFLLGFAVIRLGRRGLIAAVVFVATAAVAVGLLQSQSHGWFLYYTFQGVSHRESIFAQHALSFWTTDLLRAFPIATILGVGFCLVVWRIGSFEDRWFYPLVGLAFLGAAWETRLHPGAWRNTILPAYCFLAMATTRAAELLDRRLAGVGSALVAVQMALLFYNPQQYIPSRGDRTAAEAFVSRLRTVPGDVLVLDHGYFPTLAGKRSHAHEGAIRDVLLIGDMWGVRLDTEFRHALESKRFDLVIQDTADWFPVPIGRYYRRTGFVAHRPDELWPPTGNHVRPEFIYEPRR